MVRSLTPICAVMSGNTRRGMMSKLSSPGGASHGIASYFGEICTDVRPAVGNPNRGQLVFRGSDLLAKIGSSAKQAVVFSYVVEHVDCAADKAPLKRSQATCALVEHIAAVVTKRTGKKLRGSTVNGTVTLWFESSGCYEVRLQLTQVSPQPRRSRKTT